MSLQRSIAGYLLLAAAAVAILAWFLDVLRRHGREAAGILSGATETTLTVHFEEYRTRLRSTGQGNLEVAILDEMAVLTRSEETSYLWGLIPGGTDSAEIRVPVTYRYHVRLEDPWSLRLEDNVCVVQAPPLRPSLPPAIQTHRLTRRVESGWSEVRAQQHLREMEEGLTFQLSRESWKKVALVREEARATVARFVSAWLLQDSRWDRADHAIRVYFADEPPPPRNPPRPSPG